MTRQAVPTVQIDSDRVGVTEWRFVPGVCHNVINHNDFEFSFMEIDLK